MEFFARYIKLAKERKEHLMQRVECFLNFEGIPEDVINMELNYLVKECMRLDLRGLAVTQLIMIKQKRDELIQHQIESGFKPSDEVFGKKQERMSCFLPLILNEERRDVPK